MFNLCVATYVKEIFICSAIPKVIRLGDLDLAGTTDEAKPQDFKVKRYIIHPNFKPPAKYHDIALIELDKPVNRSNFIDIACLDKSENLNDKTYFISGWGKTEFAGK